MDEAIFCADFDHQNNQTKLNSAVFEQESVMH
jgi:hypothetical protein